MVALKNADAGGRVALIQLQCPATTARSGRLSPGRCSGSRPVAIFPAAPRRLCARRSALKADCLMGARQRRFGAGISAVALAESARRGNDVRAPPRAPLAASYGAAPRKRCSPIVFSCMVIMVGFGEAGGSPLSGSPRQPPPHDPPSISALGSTPPLLADGSARRPPSRRLLLSTLATTSTLPFRMPSSPALRSAPLRRSATRCPRTRSSARASRKS
jgi:hypothetical protein